MSGHYDERSWTPGTPRPWYACDANPCTCPKPANDNARRLAWFTTDELQAEIDRRAGAR